MGKGERRGRKGRKRSHHCFYALVPCFRRCGERTWKLETTARWADTDSDSDCEGKEGMRWFPGCDVLMFLLWAVGCGLWAVG